MPKARHGFYFLNIPICTRLGLRIGYCILAAKVIANPVMWPRGISYHILANKRRLSLFVMTSFGRNVFLVGVGWGWLR